MSQTKIKRKKIVAVVGPTASGKTELAVFLAKKFNGELISADSRQVYKGMDIGTAKEGEPSSICYRVGGKRESCARMVAGIPQHLVDLVEPDQEYNVADFLRDAKQLLKNIWAQGKLPIVVGGTGLWVEALLEGYCPAPRVDLKIRKKCQMWHKQRGLDYLVQKLKKMDPLAYKKIDLKNPCRVIRALEVFLSTGKSILELRKRKKPDYDYLMLGIDLPRHELYQRIDGRVEKMFAKGLGIEVQNLIKRYGKNCQALKAIGYREFLPHLNKYGVPRKTKMQDERVRQGLEFLNIFTILLWIIFRSSVRFDFSKFVLAKLKEEIKKDTRNLAKRQFTWWKRKKVLWVKDKKEAEKLVSDFLKSDC